MKKVVFVQIELNRDAEEAFAWWQVLFDGFYVASGRFRSDGLPICERNESPLDDGDVVSLVEAARAV